MWRTVAAWVSVLTCAAVTFGDDPQPEWKAGVVSVVITPEGPMWMAGYAARNKPSEGTEQELFAKVLVLEDAGGSRMAIVTTDLIGIKPLLRDPVAAAVEKRYGLPGHALLMNASHTHCGPELREDVAVGRDLGAEHAALARQYTQRLAEKITTAVGQAIAELRPARLQYSYGRCGFAMNRRLPTEDRGVLNSPNPDGPVDHIVPVLQVLTPGGELRAVLFGYACHNTTLSFYQFCGDYAGYAQEYLQADHPGVTALFLMGCGADQNPYPRRTLELAQQHGRALANAVNTALETKRQRAVHGPLRVALDYATLEFAPPPSRETLEQEAQSGNKYEQQHARRLLEQLNQDGEIRTEYAFPMQAAQLGDDLTLFAVSGETVVDYAHRLRTEFGGSPESYQTGSKPIVWVAGYSNHVFGYLPSRRVLEEGGYEGGGAMRYTGYPGPFASSVEKRVMSTFRELAARIRQSN